MITRVVESIKNHNIHSTTENTVKNEENTSNNEAKNDVLGNDDIMEDIVKHLTVADFTYRINLGHARSIKQVLDLAGTSKLLRLSVFRTSYWKTCREIAASLETISIRVPRNLPLLNGLELEQHLSASRPEYQTPYRRSPDNPLARRPFTRKKGRIVEHINKRCCQATIGACRTVARIIDPRRKAIYVEFVHMHKTSNIQNENTPLLPGIVARRLLNLNDCFNSYTGLLYWKGNEIDLFDDTSIKAIRTLGPTLKKAEEIGLASLFSELFNHALKINASDFLKEMRIQNARLNFQQLLVHLKSDVPNYLMNIFNGIFKEDAVRLLPPGTSYHIIVDQGSRLSFLSLDPKLGIETKSPPYCHQKVKSGRYVYARDWNLPSNNDRINDLPDFSGLPSTHHVSLVDFWNSPF